MIIIPDDAPDHGKAVEAKAALSENTEDPAVSAILPALKGQ